MHNYFQRLTSLIIFSSNWFFHIGEEREEDIYIKISFLFKGECILVRKNEMFS